MNGKQKSNIISCVSYIFVFLGFALSYMFTYPQYDVLIFTRDYESGFLTILNEAIHYGNGRLLGNVLGFYFSHHFTAAIFVTAFFLTLTVYLANRLFLDGKSKYIFPIAVLTGFLQLRRAVCFRSDFLQSDKKSALRRLPAVAHSSCCVVGLCLSFQRKHYCCVDLPCVFDCCF